MATIKLPRTGYWITTGLASLFVGCGWADLGNDQAIGRVCNLGVASGPNQATYNAAAADCPSSICLGPAAAAGATPPVPTTGATCTGECRQDSDCEGELRDPSNPADTRCARGFVCATPFEKGPLCCKKLCVCKDFLGPEGAVTPMSCVGEGALACGAEIPPPADTPVAQVTGWQSRVAKAAPVDLVAMIDNSPAMGPKIAKFNAALPRLIDSLRNPTDGLLPDLRLALIDSDLGIGSAGACPGTVASMPFGDQGRFQMRTLPTVCPFTPGSLFLEQRTGLALNYAGDISSAFACLTGNLGTAGCGLEHPLQAFEFALVARGIGNEPQQEAFLRPEAVLGLIFLTDEDDCSAHTNDGFFAPVLPAEAPSLRCATRGHSCGGQRLSASGPMYPGVASYEHPFADCQARTDSCPNPTDGSGEQTDASVPTACSPLKSVRRIADELKSLKANPDAQLVVAGIFGWPLGDVAQARYKIAPVPNPNPADTAQPTILDLWPVCHDPNHLPSPATTDPATGFDATAAAWGATPGLREAAFVDEFGANGLRFSICQPDFLAAMNDIGKAISRLTQNPCFDHKLVDLDAVTPGIQPDCLATLILPVASAGSTVYMESSLGIPMCTPGATSATVIHDCWRLDVDPVLCPASGQRISLLRPSAEVTASPLDPAVQLKLQCMTCPTITTGPGMAAGCAY